jgi:ATP-dependent helicase/nuclease subunit A
MSPDQSHFDFDGLDPLELRDADARRVAVDPRRSVALEASAGTGKTRVLVDRYVGLLLAGVRARNILAITFTRKAAAEMRQRILEELGRQHRKGELSGDLWREIRGATGEIAISTIDAFCLALVREFPLEADVDPGFELADETETPRLIDEGLDRALRRGRHAALDDSDVALVFAELGEVRLRQGLARLLDRRLVAWEALHTVVRRTDITIDRTITRLAGRLRGAFGTQVGGLEGFLACGPADTAFALVAGDLRALTASDGLRAEMVPALVERVGAYLLTQRGEPRRKLEHRIDEFRSRADYDRHKAAMTALGPYIVEALGGFRADLNLILVRGVRTLLAVALQEYRRVLQKHNVLDFSEVLTASLRLLRQMDEFSRSRFRLESRYQHLLLDEFQDTSRAQWELVQLIVRSWGEGEGVGTDALPPSIFVVGDRKQSIYRFRDAEVAVLGAAGRYIEALRPMAAARQAITRSFRSVRELLAFANDLFSLVEKQERSDAFRYDEQDAFPLASADPSAFGADPVLGVAAALTDEAQAEAVADEIARLLADGASVRDRETGVRRTIRPGDVAVLFRTRESHRLFEAALERRRVPYYVYKGLGFFDADEIKDVLALLAYLAAPESNLRAAAFLRSRFVRLSDPALRLLAPRLAAALAATEPPPASAALERDDRERLDLARSSVREWLALVDRIPPAELLERALAESAYAMETRGPTSAQARENLKKIRGLLRRMQNRGYTTLARSVEYFTRMVAGGDESNAVVDAVDAVNLMTVHAAKGLEFPVVFIVNLSKGSGTARDPVRVVLAPVGGPEDAEPAVAVGEYESDADRDDDARELEETKRLLYVAVTRARDRLYLGTSLTEEGRFAPGRGSMGRVLPSSFVELLTRAAGEDAITWQGLSSLHGFKVLRPDPAGARALTPCVDRVRAMDDFDRLSSTGPQRIPVSGVVSAPERADGDVLPTAAQEPLSTTLVGTLVHRALEGRIGLDAPVTPGNVEHTFRALVRDEEQAVAGDVDRVIARAAAVYARLVSRPDVRALVNTGRMLNELPFSLRRDGATLVRGAIDCLILAPENRVIVVEIKTGRAWPEHQAQLAVYVEAARALFPGSEVEGRLIYDD